MHVKVCAGLFVMLAASASFAQGARHELTPGRGEAALLAADTGWENAYSAKDLGRSVAACDDQASLLWPNAPRAVGRKAIAGAIADDFSKGDLTWRADAAGLARSGELGYTSGAYQWKLRGPAGGFVDNGKYLTVWKREANGAWKVLFDMFNSDLPATTN